MSEIFLNSEKMISISPSYFILYMVSCVLACACMWNLNHNEDIFSFYLLSNSFFFSLTFFGLHSTLWPCSGIANHSSLSAWCLCGAVGKNTLSPLRFRVQYLLQVNQLNFSQKWKTRECILAVCIKVHFQRYQPCLYNYLTFCVSMWKW